MSSVSSKSALPTVAEEQAVAWLVDLRDPGLAPSDIERWNRWRAAPENQQAFDAVLAVLPEIDAATRPSMPSAEELAADVYEQPAVDRDDWLRRERWKIAASFAAVALTSLLAFVVKGVWFDRVLETRASEWRSVSLTDGSVVRLEPHTSIRFEFGDDRRHIHLVHGEAYFQVAKDSARPFVVDAGLGTARAIGTAFGVTLRENRVVITVREGSVAVSQAAAGAPVTVSAGEQVTVSRKWVLPPRHVDLERELAWASGRLVFSSETVAEAVEEFNRRNRVQLQVMDPDVAAAPARGVFSSDDPESFADTLAVRFSLTIARDSPSILRLERAASREGRG